MFKPLNKILHSSLVACALFAAASAHAGDITIGADFPMSGPNATYGDIFGAGANLAAEHINADHMLDGKLTIQYEDSQALPQQGLIAMTKLVNVAKAPYVMTAFTGVSKAASTVAARTRTVAVNGGGVGPDLAELGPYFWNVIPLINAEIDTMVPYLVKERNFKRFVLIYVDDPLGQAVAKDMPAILSKVGGKMLDAMSIPVTEQQFSGIAAKVRSDNPDVIYIASYGAQELQLIKQLRDNGLTQQIASYSALAIPGTLALPQAKGALYTTQHMDWSSADPVTKRFVDDYSKKYNKQPTAYVANYYNAVRLFALLAQDLEKHKQPVTGENLLKARKEMKTFDMVGGKMVFNENGTVTMPIQVNEVEDQASKIVYAGK